MTLSWGSGGWFVVAASALVQAALSPVAFGQNPAAPKYVFEKPPEKEVDWKVQSKGGFLMTTGNSRTSSGTLSLESSRQKGSNKLSLKLGFLPQGQV